MDSRNGHRGLHAFSETYGWTPRTSTTASLDGRLVSVNSSGYRGREVPLRFPQAAHAWLSDYSHLFSRVAAPWRPAPFRTPDWHERYYEAMRDEDPIVDRFLSALATDGIATLDLSTRFRARGLPWARLRSTALGTSAPSGTPS